MHFWSRNWKSAAPQGSVWVPPLQADWWFGSAPCLLWCPQAPWRRLAVCFLSRRHWFALCRFIMENGAKGVEVIISGKLRAQRAKVGDGDGVCVSWHAKKTHLFSFPLKIPVESFGACGATKNIACVKSKERDFSHLPTLHAAVVAFVLLLTPGHEVQAGLLDLHWRAKEALHFWGCSTRPDATRYHWYQGGLVELGCFNQLREIRETCQAVFLPIFFLRLQGRFTCDHCHCSNSFGANCQQNVLCCCDCSGGVGLYTSSLFGLFCFFFQNNFSLESRNHLFWVFVQPCSQYGCCVWG